MAHGLTLTSASTIIWYGPVTSNEQYVQANGRIERIGKKHVSNIVHIEATELEHKMFERLKNKQKLQGWWLCDAMNEDPYETSKDERYHDILCLNGLLELSFLTIFACPFQVDLKCTVLCRCPGLG